MGGYIFSYILGVISGIILLGLVLVGASVEGLGGLLCGLGRPRAWHIIGKKTKGGKE